MNDIASERSTLSRLLNGKAGMSTNMAVEDIGLGTAEHWGSPTSTLEPANGVW